MVNTCHTKPTLPFDWLFPVHHDRIGCNIVHTNSLTFTTWQRRPDKPFTNCANLEYFITKDSVQKQFSLRHLLPHVTDSESRNQGIFCLWNPESGIWNKIQESGIPLRWNPESKFNWQRIRNPVSKIRNPWRGIQNLGCPWISLHAGSDISA